MLIRLRYVGVQGYPGDVRLFMEWGERVANNGPWGTYAPTYFLDYPPGYLWVLGVLARLLDGEALRLAVKAASIPADVALALAFAAILWRRAGPWRAAIAAWLWMLAPGAVIAGPYWGQADAVGTLVVFGALYYASQKRWIVAGALGALAALTKFQFGLALLVIVVSAAVEAWRGRSWRPLAVVPAAIVANVAITLPFGLGPLEQWDLLKYAGNEYPFTSLYAFNIWAIQPGFWKPDDGLVVWGGVFLGVACMAAVVALWWRRDLAALLAAGAITSLAFYFLPTRAHERYLFPALALLVPFAAARWRTLPSWLVLSVGYAVTLIFALVRTVYTDVTVPASVDAGLFGRTGQIWIAVVMCLAAAISALLVASVDRSLNAHPLGWGRWVYAARVRASERIVLWRDAIAARIVVEREHERRVQHAVLAGLLLVPVLFNAVALLPEITVALPSNNDDANHFMYVKEADAALSRGANPFDFWAPEMEFGFPPFVYYQHLPHLVVVGLSRLTFGVFDLLTLFNLVRWLLLVLLPVTVWWSLRKIGVPAPGAVLAGAAAALVSADGKFGIEYDSFVWRGWGMYTQLWAVHLTFIGLALLHDFLERGRGLVRTILVLSALALSHLIWAYMAAISAFVILVVGLRHASWQVRIARLVIAGAGTAVLTSYMWLPFLMQRQYLNVSQPYLPDWRFDSFGFGQIARWFALGDLFDHGRVPLLTWLVVAGVIAAVRARDRLASLAIALAAVWVTLWSGRTSLGPIADLLPFSHGLHVHRFVGGVDVAAILLIGLAGAGAWRLLRADATPRRSIVTGALMLAVLVPAMAERADYYGWNTTWMTQTRDALARDGDVESLVAAFEELPAGRVYAGMNNNDWQRSLDLVSFNSVRLPDVLNFNGIARMAKPYASLSLDADLAFSFDPNDRAHWDLFNVRYAVARAGQTVPPFLAPLRTVGKYVIYAAPTSGWVAFAQAFDSQSVSTDEKLFFDLLETIAPARTATQRYTTYTYPAPDTKESAPTATCFDGRVVAYERMQVDRYDALIGCSGNFSLVILKVTYHPNWRVMVDDIEAETFMASPGFLAFQMKPGQHFVTAQYVSTPVKAPLLWLGLVGAIVLALFRRHLVRPPYTW